VEIGHSKAGKEVEVAGSETEILTVQCQRDKHKLDIQSEDKKTVVLYSVWTISAHEMSGQQREWVSV